MTMLIRRAILAVAAGILLVATQQPAHSSQQEMGLVELTLGQPRFWDGPHTDAYRLVPGDPNRPRWKWTLRVPDGGWRLRVGIDHPDHTDSYSLDLYGPKGEWRGFAGTVYDTSEVMVWDAGADPGYEVPSGDWTVVVSPTNVTDSAFTLRARLESEPPAQPVGRELRPNLRAEPPFDVRLRLKPLQPFDWIGELPGPASCLPDEVAEDRVLRCLRFAFGYQNTGAGPYELRLVPRTGNPLVADVVHRVYLADETPWDFADNDATGAYIDAPAGEAHFHDTHGHWHYDNIVVADLLRVGPGGALSPVAPTAKRGACAHDWEMVEFHRFYQDQRSRHDSSRSGGRPNRLDFVDPEADRCNAVVPTENLPTGQSLAIALSVGWADVYPSDLSDNYVPFDGVADGEFVLRLTVDAGGVLREIDEADNTGYAHIRVDGGEVTLLERGRGTDPWDPAKVVLSLTGIGQ